jgi:succinate dehydrogenase / fumarate reductase iron-sulfur subunit
MRLTFLIRRFNPETDSHPRTQACHLDVGRGATVLDTLIRIKNEQDGSLALRYSCRSAICGSCAMDINGSEKLACRTSVRKEWERHGEVAVGPLRNLPVIKDLVVDMSSFWGKIRDIMPWLAAESRDAVASGSSRRLLPPGSHRFHNVDACIMCGACVAACTVHEVSKGFLGPAALAKADRFVADPREPSGARRHRLTLLEQEHGIWDCTRCNFCVEVCPKDVKPMEAIIRLRRAAIESGLTSSGGARHVTGFTDLIRRHGRLNEALMPLKIVGFDLRRLLGVLPLGLAMLRKGKVPNPLAPAFPGIARIRAIIAGPGRPPGTP